MREIFHGSIEQIMGCLDFEISVVTRDAFRYAVAKNKRGGNLELELWE